MLKPATLSPVDSAAIPAGTRSGDASTTCAAACPWLAVGTLVSREWVRFIRQRNRVVGAVGQPIIFWLLFGAGLGPSFRMPGAVGDSISYRAYFFPGSLILILLFTAIFATISIIEDRREGFLQSVLVAPLPRWSMVLGKVLGGTLLALAQGLLFLALGFAAGVRFGPLAGLEIVALVFVVSLGLTALGFVIAWRMDSTQGFHAIMSVFLMPMWLLSGAFFPAPAWSTAADWGQRILALVMAANPLTYGVAALRRLLYDGLPGAIGPDTPSLPLCWLVSLGFAALMLALAWRIAAQRTTGDLL
jgi:ABC-2 type transport system permease protein